MRLNVLELKRIAAKSVNADNCSSTIKIAEGNSNKVFQLVMDDGRAVVVPIPHPNAGPPFPTIASEVASMDFVRIYQSFNLECVN
jgi:hypothetical protein